MQIVRKMNLPAPSGADIFYDLLIECSGPDEPTCENVTGTIPLPQEIEDASVVGQLDPELVSGVNFVRGTGLAFDFSDTFGTGTTFTIPIKMHTENGTTPDGFEWNVDFTVVGDNAPEMTAHEVGRVQATPELSLDKYVNPAKVRLDQTARYTLRVCGSDPDRLGSLFLDDGRLVDQLPVIDLPGGGQAVPEFVAASNGGSHDPAMNSVTWDIPRMPQAPRCDMSYWVDVIYHSDDFGVIAPRITTVTNEAEVFATPLGGGDELHATDSVTHQFTDTVSPGGIFDKVAVAPLGRTTQGGAPRTYPGEWLSDRLGGFEATWQLNIWNNGDVPIGMSVHDRLPCSYANGARPAHVSPLDGEPVCTAPTFVTEAVDISMQPPVGGAYRSAIEDNGYTPRWVSTSGATGAFALDSINAQRARFVPSGLPAGDVVAEVIVPERSDIVVPPGSIPVTFASLRGHMIEDEPAGTYADAGGSPVLNEARFTAFYAGAEVGIARETAEIDVLLPQTQLDIIKGIRADGTVVLEARNYGVTPVGGIVMTDLLPPDVTFRPGFDNESVVLNGLFETRENSLVPDAIDLEVIDNYHDTGRQLVRITLRPGYALHAYDEWTPGSYGAGNLVVIFHTNGLSTTERPVGVTTNTSQVHLPDDDLDACTRYTPGLVPIAIPTSAQDPDDLDDDGRTQDAFCQASASVSRASGPAALRAVKMVEGSEDTAFTGFPSVGNNKPGEIGTFQLRLSNPSDVAITPDVVYDVLPRIGDTGTKLVNVARHSSTDAFLASTPTVLDHDGTALSGAVVEYSTDDNPCRNELRPTGAAAPWPSGCVDDWSATQPALGDVTAIRVSGIGSIPARSARPFATIDYDVLIPSSAQPGDVAWNSFAYASSQTDNGAALLPTEPPKVGLAIPRTDVELDKVLNGFTVVAPGDLLKYKITARHGTTVSVDPVTGEVTYTNTSGSAPATAEDVVVKDVLPAGVTYVEGSANALCGKDQPGGYLDEATMEWHVGDIDPGQSFSLCFSVQVNDDATGTLTNEAEVFAMGPDSPEDIDSTPGNSGTNPARTTTTGSA